MSSSMLTADTVRHAVLCPSCGARSQLRTRPAPDTTGTQHVPVVVQFRCINQMARAHRSPTDSQLHTLINRDVAA